MHFHHFGLASLPLSFNFPEVARGEGQHEKTFYGNTKTLYQNAANHFLWEIEGSIPTVDGKNFASKIVMLPFLFFCLVTPTPPNLILTARDCPWKSCPFPEIILQVKTFLIAILNLGVRGEWGGCVVVDLGNFPALIRHVCLALAKFFPSTVQDGTISVFFRFMF